MKMEAALLKPSLKRHKTGNFPPDINFCGYFFAHLNCKNSQESHIKPDPIRCNDDPNARFAEQSFLTGKASWDELPEIAEGEKWGAAASLFCPGLVLCKIKV